MCPVTWASGSVLGAGCVWRGAVRNKHAGPIKSLLINLSRDHRSYWRPSRSTRRPNRSDWLYFFHSMCTPLGFEASRLQSYHISPSPLWNGNHSICYPGSQGLLSRWKYSLCFSKLHTAYMGLLGFHNCRSQLPWCISFLKFIYLSSLYGSICLYFL